MSRKLTEATTLVAALALAGAGIFGTAASAKPYPGDSACEQAAINTCFGMWQFMGYASYGHCVTYLICQNCPTPGQVCPYGPDATDPDAVTKPW